MKLFIRSPRRGFVAAVLCAVVGSLLVAAPAQADAPSAAWAGSISVEYVQGATGFEVKGTGVYTQLEARDNNGYPPVEYTANVDVDFLGKNLGICPVNNTYQVLVTAPWKFNGPSTSATDGNGQPIIWGNQGSALRLWDTEAGTMFLPEMVVFNAWQSWNCGDPHQAYQANDALSYHYGWALDSDTPLVDNDPDPNHLVGTTTYTLGDPPGEAPWEYTTYSYKIIYDLTRDVQDTDGDTIPDGLDNCKYVINLDQTNTDGDAVGDACENDFAAKDDSLRHVTTDDEIALGVGSNDTTGFRQVNWIAGEAGFPGTVRVEAGTIVWQPPRVLDQGDKPILGTYQLTYESESHTGDRDTATASITLYDCVEHRNAGNLGEWKLGWDLTACFDGADTWFENLETGESTGVTESTPGNPVSTLLGVSTQWTQGPATVFGLHDPVVVRSGEAGSYFVEGTSQLCFDPLAGVDLVQKALRAEIKRLLIAFGLEAAGQMNEVIGAILSAGQGCLNIAKVRIDVISNPDGTYYTKVRVDDLRPRARQLLNNQYTAHHEIGISDSGHGKQVAETTVTRTRQKHAEAWWSCDVYLVGCKPSVSPRR